jgi:hypothetical protein
MSDMKLFGRDYPTPGELICEGVRQWWASVKHELRDSWQEAYRLTYGDGCTHPPAMRSYDKFAFYLVCGQCGRTTTVREAATWGDQAQWFTAEERRNGLIQYQVEMPSSSPYQFRMIQRPRKAGE